MPKLALRAGRGKEPAGQSRLSACGGPAGGWRFTSPPAFSLVEAEERGQNQRWQQQSPEGSWRFRGCVQLRAFPSGPQT